MAKTVKPLTVTEINNAKAKEKDYYLSDGHGLLLFIRKNSSKKYGVFSITNLFIKKEPS
ncbi:hypothetical protein ACFGZ9_04300 [Pasteurella multocida]